MCWGRWKSRTIGWLLSGRLVYSKSEWEGKYDGGGVRNKLDTNLSRWTSYSYKRSLYLAQGRKYGSNSLFRRNWSSEVSFANHLHTVHHVEKPRRSSYTCQTSCFFESRNKTFWLDNKSKKGVSFETIQQLTRMLSAESEIQIRSFCFEINLFILTLKIIVY